MSRILIADDEPDILLIVSERLRRSGYDVTYAADGEQAVKKIEESEFDLLILDVHMPGKNGYEVCAYAKNSEKNSKTPVLLISAFQEEQVKWQQSRADAFLAKPFETGKLTKEVEHFLKKTPRDEVSK